MTNELRRTCHSYNSKNWEQGSFSLTSLKQPLNVESFYEFRVLYLW